MPPQGRTFHRSTIFLYFSSIISTSCIPTTIWIDDIGQVDSNAFPDTATETGNANPRPAHCEPALPGPIDLNTPVGENEYAQFQLESVDWALGLIHANHQLVNLTEQHGGPELSPSWFLSMALNATAMDCAQPGGCYSFSESNHWTLLCDLYEEVDCSSSSMNDVLGASGKGEGHAGAATMALAWHTALSFALLPQGGFSDPSTWFDNATDDQALEKVMVLSTIDSPWGSTLRAVAEGCQNRAIEDCIDEERTWMRDQVVAVAAHMAELDAAVAAGHCLELSLRESDIQEYGAQLSGLFPSFDWETASSSAASVLDGDVNLLDNATTVVHRLDESSGLQLNCPEEALDTQYDTACPE